MKLSIITPTRGCSLNLKNYFDSLHTQDIQDNIEVLLCTTSSSASPLALPLPTLSSHFTVRTLSISQTGIARARNHGLSAAQGEYVFFLDDDCALPHKRYLADAIRKIDAQPSSGWAGSYIVADASLKFTAAFYNYLSLLWLNSFKHKDRLYVVLGGCAFFKRQTLIACGAHFEENEQKAGEEFLFSKKITDSHIHIKYSQELNVLHNPRCNLLSLIKKSWHHGLAIGNSTSSPLQNRWVSYITFFRQFPLQSLLFFPLLVLFLSVGRFAFVWNKISTLASTIDTPFLKRS